jgi:hypothetical protein
MNAEGFASQRRNLDIFLAGKRLKAPKTGELGTILPV